MGRGRAKAKQQKVARDLKYSTHFTDLDALQRELGTSDSGHGRSSPHAPGTSDGDGEFDDPADDDSDYEGWTGTER